jgi:hypothetical protein
MSIKEKERKRDDGWERKDGWGKKRKVQRSGKRKYF